MTVEQVRLEKYRETGYRCEVCGKYLWATGAIPQLAHRIPQRKWCLKRWGKEIIHHPDNLALVCGLECNAKVQINPDGVDAAVLAAKIGLKLEKLRAQSAVGGAR